jgi:hypothetical protein
MTKLMVLVFFCVIGTQIECSSSFRGPGFLGGRRSPIFVGGRLQKDLNNPQILARATELAQFALDIKSISDQTAYGLSEINTYSSQLVNGHNHFLSLRIFDNNNDFDYPANVFIHEPFRGPLRLVNFVALIPRIVLKDPIY